jgi:hypothetical protein
MDFYLRKVVQRLQAASDVPLPIDPQLRSQPVRSATPCGKLAPVKFQCTSCERLVELERFRLDGAALVVTCPACGADTRSAEKKTVSNVVALRTPTVEAISRAANAVGESDPFAVPEGFCPKCISRRADGASACSSCGMVFGQTVDTFAPSDWLKGRWVELLSTWGEDAKHEALRTEAMGKAELAELGRLYRLRLADAPQDPYAVRGRDEVLRLAVLPSISLRQAQGEPKTQTWKYVALSAIIAACLMALFFLVRNMLALS